MESGLGSGDKGQVSGIKTHLGVVIGVDRGIEEVYRDGPRVCQN